MKKFFLCLAVLCMSTSLFAETVLIDGLYYSLGNTTASLVKDQTTGNSVYGSYINLTVPASVYYNNYTYPVVTIGTSAFELLEPAVGNAAKQHYDHQPGCVLRLLEIRRHQLTGRTDDHWSTCIL
jgi:hypothetical protein